jgi:hypothetical protein
MFETIKGYQNWGKLLGTIAKLRWFDDNNYLEGFCMNHNYNFDEIRGVLKFSNAIINGDTTLLSDLKSEMKKLKQQEVSFTEYDFENLSVLMP